MRVTASRLSANKKPSRGMRARAYHQQREQQARDFHFTETVMAFDDPEAVGEWSSRPMPARMAQDGKVYAVGCVRGWDRETAIAWDAEPETLCAGCGKALVDHEAAR